MTEQFKIPHTYILVVNSKILNPKITLNKNKNHQNQYFSESFKPVKTYFSKSKLIILGLKPLRQKAMLSKRNKQRIMNDETSLVRVQV